MLVSEIMTKNVVTVNSDYTILEACKRYFRHRIGCLVVLQDRRVVGIVTERDLISKVIIGQKDHFEVKVKAIMSKDIITIHPDADVKEAADVMKKNKIKKLPVVSDNGDLVGIITITDIIYVMPHYFKTLAQECRIE